MLSPTHHLTLHCGCIVVTPPPCILAPLSHETAEEDARGSREDSHHASAVRSRHRQGTNAQQLLPSQFFFRFPARLVPTTSLHVPMPPAHGFSAFLGVLRCLQHRPHSLPHATYNRSRSPRASLQVDLKKLREEVKDEITKLKVRLQYPLTLCTLRPCDHGLSRTFYTSVLRFFVSVHVCVSTAAVGDFRLCAARMPFALLRLWSA